MGRIKKYSHGEWDTISIVIKMAVISETTQNGNWSEVMSVKGPKRTACFSNFWNHINEITD